MSFFESIDAVILERFQKLSIYVNVILIANFCIGFSILLRLISGGSSLAVAVSTLITLVGGCWFISTYKSHKEGEVNRNVHSLFSLRLAMIAFLLLSSVVPDPLYLIRQLIEVSCVYLLCTTKVPKPPSSKLAVAS